MTYAPGQIAAALRVAQPDARGNEEWQRINATWRGGNGFSVAVNCTTGGWKDHKAGEGGTWEKLCGLLKLEPGALVMHTTAEAAAAREAAANYQSGRVARAGRLFKPDGLETCKVTADSAEDQIEQLKGRIAAAKKNSREWAAYSGRPAKALETQTAGHGYLDIRGARRFAAAAGAVIGSRTTEEGESVFEIRWLIRSDFKSEIIAIQRESGRGHAGKSMMGRHMGGSAYVAPRAQSDIFVIGEGMMSVKAVWNNFDVHGWIKYTAGNIAALNGQLFKEIKVKEIWLACDHDASNTGQKACQRAAESILLVRPDLTVKIAMPPTEGDDWDSVESKNPAEFRAIFMASLADPIRPTPTGPGGEDAPGEEIINLSGVRDAPGGGTLGPVAKGVSLTQATAKLEADMMAEVRLLAEKNRKPVIFQVPAGTGKTAAAAKMIAVNRQQAVKTQNFDHAAPTIIVTPLTSDRDKIAEAIAKTGLSVHVHEARSKGNCQVMASENAKRMTELADAGRSPFAWECKSCVHGLPTETRPAGVPACLYLRQLKESLSVGIVVATHAAIQEDSTLLHYTTGEPGVMGEIQHTRTVVYDEEIKRDRLLNMTNPELTAARIMNDPAIDPLAEQIRKTQAELANPAADVITAEKRIRALEKAVAWTREIAAPMDQLQADLAHADPKKRVLIEGENADKLAALLSSIPPLAMHYDGTIIESVTLARKADRLPPRAWMKSLGQAITERTAWYFGGEIVGGHASRPWLNFLKDGGLYLDATPHSRALAEVLANGGRVHNIEVEAPQLKVTQYTSHLFGRRDLKKSNVIEKFTSRILPMLEAKKGSVAVLTHKPVGQALHKARPDLAEYIGWYGRDSKAHNRFEKCEKLVCFGANLMNVDLAVIQYAIDRTAVSRSGVEWAAWDGETVENAWVEIAGGKEMQSRVRLPTVPDARAWWLDRYAAETAQQIGRLRAPRRTSPVTVDVVGGVPLVGHGLVVHEVAMMPGRATQRADQAECIAAAVISINEHGEALTLKRLAAWVFGQTGETPSACTLAKMLNALRRSALVAGIPLNQTCRNITAMIQTGRDSRGVPIPTAATAMSAARKAGPGSNRIHMVAYARLKRPVELATERRSPGVQRAAG